MKLFLRAFFLLALQMAGMEASMAISYGGLGGRPAFPREEEPRTESIFVHELEPGAVQEEGVYIINHDPTPKTALIYATDSTPSSDGAFACEQASEPKSDVGAWVSFPQESYSLQAGEALFVPFVITVPEAVDVGEHNGCIFIQEADVIDPLNASTGVQISTRMGMRVAITIPGEIVVQLEDLNLMVDQSSGFYKVSAANTGNVSVDAALTLRTVGLWGDFIAESSSTYPVLRQESASWQFPMGTHFWGGWFKTQVLVDYKALNQPGMSEKSMVSPTLGYFVMPAPMALVIYLGSAVLILALAFVSWRSLRTRARIKKMWKARKVDSKQTIVELAQECGVSWKLIARVNRLAPPYDLKNHGTLLLPPPKRK
jgi:hypothetical protein